MTLPTKQLKKIESDENIVRYMIEAGCNVTEISEQTVCSRSQVSRIIKKLGLKTKRKKHKKPRPAHLQCGICGKKAVLGERYCATHGQQLYDMKDKFKKKRRVN